MLLARKREKNLDEKWVARLKAQARAFESQLYKNATSLESYKDCTTLKRRIAKLADAFASYFKQAKQRKSLLRNPSAEQTSMSVLGSLDVHLSDDDLPGTSMESLPSSLTGRKVSNLRRQISLPVASNSVSLLPGPLMNNIARAQSDTMGATGHNFGRISSGSNMSSSMVGGNFSSMMSSNLGGMMGPMGMQQQQQNNQQLEQQLLASIQQQRAMARQMGIGGGQAQTGNHSLMTGQATMMGNNGMSMLSQMQQQSTNPMMMNLMQQQQSLLQQQQNSMGLNMMQNPNATMMMGNNGINVMNMNMPNVIPAVGNMQGMNFGSSSMMGSQESMMMPPPGMLNTQGMTNRLSGANDDTSPLSPGTFHW